MKSFISFITTFIVLFISSMLFAQLPSRINYQGVARNAEGVLLQNHSLSITFKIYEEGAEIHSYEESKKVTTNKFGVFFTQIGQNGLGSLTLDSLDWKNGKRKEIETIYDFNNDQVPDLGTHRIPFQSVPYSIHSITTDHSKTASHSIESDSSVFAENAYTSILSDTSIVAHKLKGFANFWTPQFNNIIYSTGNIGIGDTDFVPQARLHIDKGDFRINFGDIVLLDGNLGFGTVDTKTKLHIKSGSVYLEDSTSGIYFKSSNGSCYLLKVNNIGELQLEVKTCP